MQTTSWKSFIVLFFAVVWSGLMVWVYLLERKELSFVDSVNAQITNISEHQSLLDTIANESDNTVRDIFEEKEDSFQEDTPSVPNREVFINDTPPSLKESVDSFEGDVVQPEEQTGTENDLEEDQGRPETTLEISYNLCGDFPCYTDSDFVNIYNQFENNHPNLDFLTKYIYQVSEVDTYIKQKAEERGYRQRGFARVDEIISFENVQTRPEVRDSYIAMRNEMLKEGIHLHFVSGYRTSSSQRLIFKNKMGMIAINEIPLGIHDEKIDEALSVSAIPGYSKHHSGYAVDFGCGNNQLVYGFAETECYAWLSANNFENAKKHGFIPSYPYSVDKQGPNPEPWEYVWVGVGNLK